MKVQAAQLRVSSDKFLKLPVKPKMQILLQMLACW